MTVRHIGNGGAPVAGKAADRCAAARPRPRTENTVFAFRLKTAVFRCFCFQKRTGSSYTVLHTLALDIRARLELVTLKCI